MFNHPIVSSAIGGEILVENVAGDNDTTIATRYF
jgi:hypothetical protein